jgi:hypothetical protein
MRCHDVFHVSLLRKFHAVDRNQPPPPPGEVKNGQAFWEVESIVGHKPRTAKSHSQVKTYQIKWKGYPVWENSDEPAANVLEDAPLLVEAYWQAKNVLPGHSRSQQTMQTGIDEHVVRESETRVRTSARLRDKAVRRT